MYYEKWGFMLIFWNLAGVPLSYCHCTIYLANHDPLVYRWNLLALVIFYVAYLFVYWVWDTANSQKNRFRLREKGIRLQRKAFPQLPWGELQNPRTIRSESGDTLLADGWCMFIVYHVIGKALIQRQGSALARFTILPTCILLCRGD